MDIRTLPHACSTDTVSLSKEQGLLSTRPATRNFLSVHPKRRHRTNQLVERAYFAGLRCISTSSDPSGMCPTWSSASRYVSGNLAGHQRSCDCLLAVALDTVPAAVVNATCSPRCASAGENLENENIDSRWGENCQRDAGGRGAGTPSLSPTSRRVTPPAPAPSASPSPAYPAGNRISAESV